MKKIVASVGLVALGASAIQASAQDLGGPDTSKPWSVSATLRGFYDDNTSTVPDDLSLPAGAKRDSFGYEISPSATLAWTLEQTTISLGYLYSYKYYENRLPFSTDHDNMVHTFNASVTHAFSERFQGSVRDSFVIGQEPDLLRAGNTFSTFQRVSGDNIRNYGAINFDAQLTPVLGLDLGYDNVFFDYDDTGARFNNAGNFVGPSVGGLLNRIENGVHLEGLYTVQPETKALVGYRFRDIAYTADELIGVTIFSPVRSDDRNTRGHTAYVGAEHSFRPDLSGAVRVGGSYYDYYNTGADGVFSPYVSASLKYTYAPESFIQGGVSYDRSATDVIGADVSGFTTDAESGVIYATVNHRITPKIYVSATAQFQNSTLNGGQFDDDSEQYYLVGLNAEYRFNRNFSAHVGYNYDNLSSDLDSALDRSFDRNRVYMGVTASY